MDLKNELFFLAGMLVLSCSNYPSDTSNRDLYEMESVWQYLMTYCIWQDTLWHDTLPVDAFKYDTPEELLASVHDTLFGLDPHYFGPAANYTSYDDSKPNIPQGKGAAAASSPTVAWESLTDSTGYIGIYHEFVAETYEAFLHAVDSVIKFPNIIIDLRYNGGGNLDATDSIIQSILPDSTPYIIEKYRKYDHLSRQAKTVDWDTMWTNHGRQLAALKNKRFAVLANRGSASASEILVAALKDGFAQTPTPVVLVGDTTYGKGMGQIVITREHLGRRNIKITFLRIKGLTDRVGYYHRKGIWPDVLVENQGQSRWGDSLQLSAALKTLEPSAQLHKPIILQKRNTLPVSDIHEASIIASPDDAPVKQTEAPF